MLFFEFLWITSTISSFFSLSEKLPANLTPKVLPAKVSNNLGKFVSKHRPLFVVPKQPGKVWSTTLLPTRFLRIDWHNNDNKTNLEQSQNSPRQTVKKSKKELCSAGQEVAPQQPVFRTSSGWKSGTIINSSSANQDFFTQKILRSLQDFFRFTSPLEQNFMSAASPVVVVHRDRNNYEVWVNNRLVATLPTEAAAKSMQQRLTNLAKLPNLDANQLRPALVDGIPALMAGNRFLWGIEKQISERFHKTGELLAIEWINNLRSAFKAPTLTLVEGQKEMYGVSPSSRKLSGLASWYGGYFHGRLTANGEIYNQDELTVAHKSLPFNTYLQVKNLQTGKAVIVRVNDRGPYIEPRSLDLSRIAARCLGSEIAGVVPYEAVILQSNQPKMTLKASTLTKAKPKPVRQLALVSEF
ncbi:septal ring lytic transglycosylase RlpA family protein [Tolypothrix sp. PCC 7910]|uniref:septal ring lytic transglycosylase RlpA family protein n=1 Tax=Tolypothrix sp. PCC 7910 TaxID=2099387 RepID=UPI0014278525|nr:septal ring lytic transglycosylase RlpA family protein [Tolypothrix sp. PCC 7910]QIR39852.1 septal ring lytic transglycosylase RlpA family protein [Tolypothrix sp. PCC 7910]